MKRQVPNTALAEWSNFAAHRRRHRLRALGRIVHRHPRALLRARSRRPRDPVCGSGDICVAAYLCHHRDTRFGSSYVARQGMQLGRDGRVSVRFDSDSIHIGGRAVTCVEGTLNI